LIFFESWRSRRKETSRHEDVTDRLAELEESEMAARRALVELEREVLQLRAKNATGSSTSPVKRILPRDIWDVPDKDQNKNDEKTKSWLSRIAAYISSGDSEKLSSEPGPAEKIIAQSDTSLTGKHRQPLEEAVAANEKAKS
jgi:myosin-1